jgi:hypothetical protein
MPRRVSSSGMKERISLSSDAAEFSVFAECEGMRCAPLETNRGRSVNYSPGVVAE